MHNNIYLITGAASPHSFAKHAEHAEIFNTFSAISAFSAMIP